MGREGPDPHPDRLVLPRRDHLRGRRHPIPLLGPAQPRAAGHQHQPLPGPLSDPWTLAADPVEISRPEYDWETAGFAVNEGPAAIERGGKVFIAYSAAATGAEYCMGLLSAEVGADLLDVGSWSKSPKPVFATSAQAGIFGPGHNCFTVDEGGRDLLVYHARGYERIEGDPLDNPDRHCRVQAFGWSEEGLPEFGEPCPES
ncbi:hypothetical protein GCM10029992_44160 [Glycomyces albus]